MGLSRLVQKIILSIIDLVVIILLSINWGFGFSLLIKNNSKTFKKKMLSMITLSIDLVIFIIIFKNNISHKYKGSVGIGILGRFFTLSLYIPGTLIFADIYVSYNDRYKENVLLIILLINLVSLIGSILLDMLVKNETKVIEKILNKSIEMDNGRDYRMFSSNELNIE